MLKESFEDVLVISLPCVSSFRIGKISSSSDPFNSHLSHSHLVSKAWTDTTVGLFQRMQPGWSSNSASPSPPRDVPRGKREPSQTPTSLPMPTHCSLSPICRASQAHTPDSWKPVLVLSSQPVLADTSSCRYATRPGRRIVSIWLRAANLRKRWNRRPNISL